MGNTSVMQITVGVCGGWPYRGAIKVPCGAEKAPQKMDFSRFCKGLPGQEGLYVAGCIAPVYGLFVAVPQIAMNCSMPFGKPATPTKTIARRARGW
jgi:hypothetical protein